MRVIVRVVRGGAGAGPHASQALPGAPLYVCLLESYSCLPRYPIVLGTCGEMDTRLQVAHGGPILAAHTWVPTAGYTLEIPNPCRDSSECDPRATLLVFAGTHPMVLQPPPLPFLSV